MKQTEVNKDRIALTKAIMALKGFAMCPPKITLTECDNVCEHCKKKEDCKSNKSSNYCAIGSQCVLCWVLYCYDERNK